MISAQKEKLSNVRAARTLMENSNISLAKSELTDKEAAAANEAAV